MAKTPGHSPLLQESQGSNLQQLVTAMLKRREDRPGSWFACLFLVTFLLIYTSQDPAPKEMSCYQWVGLPHQLTINIVCQPHRHPYLDNSPLGLSST